MTNTDLIARLRAEGEAWREQVGGMPLLDEAANALEAAVQRITELEADAARLAARDEEVFASLIEQRRLALDERDRLAAKIAELEAENDVKSDHITALVTVTNRLAATIEQAKAALELNANYGDGGFQAAGWLCDLLESADTSVLADRDAAKFREGQRSVTIGFTPGEGRPVRIFEDNPYERREEPSECGDYPAPCNCDDPVTHNGHNARREERKR